MDEEDGDPDPPAMTPYGVDQYELEDIRAVADIDGITLEEALRRHGWQNQFSDVLMQVMERHPDTFADSEVNPIPETPSAVIRFKGPVPDDVPALVRSLPVPVALLPDAPYSQLDMEALNDVAAATLVRLLPGMTFVAGLDGDTDAFEATVQVPTGTEHTPLTIRAAIEHDMRAARPDLAVPEIQITTASGRVADAM